MAKIEGIRVANYRVLKNVTLGKLWNTQKVDPLTPMTAVIGKNGVGKSSLSDAFGFLTDCLKLGVEEACDVRGRGGFRRIRSQGSTGPNRVRGLLLARIRSSSHHLRTRHRQPQTGHCDLRRTQATSSHIVVPAVR